MGTLDIKNLVREKMAAHGLPAALVAEVSGVSTSALSRWFNGGLVLNSSIETRILDRVNQLVAFIELARPLPLDFRRSDTVKELLNQLSENELSISVRGKLEGGLLALAGG
jgi:transcriptional regulator with XRE-family HTH domain